LPLWRTALIVTFSPRHIHITRFFHSHVSRQEISWTATKHLQFCSADWHGWRFQSAFGHFGTHWAESFPMSKSSRVMDPARSRERLIYLKLAVRLH
jgi:hypothetical protein